MAEKPASGTILLIDDDTAIRDSFRLVLEVVGYTVYTAENGRDGLDVLAKMPMPNLIFLDLMMPVMDGWSFVNELGKHEIYNQIPVVVVSAFFNKLKPIRAVEFVEKPVEIERLYQVAARYCTPAAV